MHIVERNTLDTLQQLVTEHDPDNLGWCIDGGAGIQDFFGVHFATWGYTSLIVEPLPSEMLLRTLSDAHLETAALCATDGIVTLYEGHDGNTHSLDANWEQVTGHPHKKTPINVPGIRYETLLDEWKIDRVTCLKLDIEGSEHSVILQLLDDVILPDVVSIEYGGGYAKSSGMGGWTAERFNKIIACLDILRACGYTHGAHCEDEVYEFNFGVNPRGIWREDAGYGNLIAWGI